MFQKSINNLIGYNIRTMSSLVSISLYDYWNDVETITK